MVWGVVVSFYLTVGALAGCAPQAAPTDQQGHTPAASSPPTVPPSVASSGSPSASPAPLTRRPASDPVWLISGRTPVPTEPTRPTLPAAPATDAAGVARLRGGWDGVVTVAASDGTRVMCARGAQTVGSERITSYTYAISSAPRDPALGTASDLGVEPGSFAVLLTRDVHGDGSYADTITVTLNDGAGRATGFTDASFQGHDRYPPVVAISGDRRTARFAGDVAVVSDELVNDVPTSWETLSVAIRCPAPLAAPGR